MKHDIATLDGEHTAQLLVNTGVKNQQTKDTAAIKTMKPEVAKNIGDITTLTGQEKTNAADIKANKISVNTKISNEKTAATKSNKATSKSVSNLGAANKILIDKDQASILKLKN